MAAGGNADVCAKTSFKLKFSRASLWSSWRSLSFRPLWQLQLVRLQVSMAIQAVLSVRTFPRAQSLQNFVPLFFWWSYLWLWLALRWFWCWRRLINPMHQRSLMTSGFCMLLHTLRLPSFKQHHWNLKRTPWDGRQTLFCLLAWFFCCRRGKTIGRYWYFFWISEMIAKHTTPTNFPFLVSWSLHTGACQPGSFFLTARRKQRCFLTLGALLRPETQRTFSFLAMAKMFFQGSWRQKMKALVNIEFRHSAWHQSDPRDDVTTTPVNIGYASYLIEPKISAHLHMSVMAMTDWGIDRIVHNMISISCITPTILSKRFLSLSSALYRHQSHATWTADWQSNTCQKTNHNK